MTSPTADRTLLETAARLAIDYASTVDDRAAAPTAEAIVALDALGGPLPDAGRDADEVIELLARVGGAATMATTGPHYFGFVNGATFPVALAASFLVDAWDQNAALPVMSPVSATLHEVTRGWLAELLGFVDHTEVAFVTGATVANATCLAAARDALLIEPRLGRAGRRAVRRSRAAGGDRREGAQHAAQVTRPGGPGARPRDRRPGGRPGSDHRERAARPRPG